MCAILNTLFDMTHIHICLREMAMHVESGRCWHIVIY